MAYEKVRNYIALKSGIFEHHINFTAITVEEWNLLWNKLAMMADELGVSIADLIDALLQHIEGVVTLPQNDEDLTGRHGLKVDPVFHAAAHWVRETAKWWPITTGWDGSVPLIDMDIINPDRDYVIPPDQGAADAHVVRIIYLMLLDLAERVNNLEADLVVLEGRIEVIEDLLERNLPSDSEKEWLTFASKILWYVQTTQPQENIPLTWENRKVIWIDSTRI